MKNYRIAVIAGDGIGREVVPAGIDALNLAAEQGGFRCEFTQIPWGCDYYLEHGRMMDEDGVDRLMKFDAIYLGAIGDPRVADHISARELLKTRDVENLLRSRPTAEIPFADVDMIRSVNEGAPIVLSRPSSPAGLAIQRLTAALVGAELRSVPRSKPPRERRALFSRG